jgi:drug/metabolite transporter (DMT)-like permease
MRLFALTALIMLAFAANSVLNRLALADGAIGAGSFAAIRVLAGAVMLAGLAWWRSGAPWPLEARISLRRAVPVLALCLYLLGFSYAYLTLDAGLGALILFGGVQVTMFAGAVLGGEAIPAGRWAGAGLASLGLVALLWPVGASAPPLLWAGAMGVAAVGWGLYSLAGRAEPRPLEATAANFLLSIPLVLAVAGGTLGLESTAPSARGVWLAVVSGAVMSGLGYALWYGVLPQLGAPRAALAQLCVQVIEMAGGMLFLDEVMSLRFAGAGLLVLGGIALGLMPPQRRIGSSGS